MLDPVQFIPSLATLTPAPAPTGAGPGAADFQTTLDSSAARLEVDRVLRTADRLNPPELRSPPPDARPPSDAPAPQPRDWSEFSFDQARAELARLQADIDAGNADHRTVGLKLLRLQMDVQHFAFRSELATKIVDQIAGGVRNVLQTQA